MTVHPFRSGTRSKRSSAPCPDDSFGIGADVRLDDLVDQLPDATDRYGSHDRSSHFAHRVVTPQLIAGIQVVDLDVCQAFHFAIFRLLEDLGKQNGLVAAPEFFVDVGTTRMSTADRWLWDHPAPGEGSPERPGREAVADHSLALATALGTRPSLTFGSVPAVTEHLLGPVLELVGPERRVSDDQIDALVTFTLRMLSYLPRLVEIVGGVSVWAADLSPSAT